MKLISDKQWRCRHRRHRERPDGEKHTAEEEAWTSRMILLSVVTS
ncbi:MAG: hypothetical protein SNJ29_08470 [Rikenellaceae bacterium]